MKNFYKIETNGYSYIYMPDHHRAMSSTGERDKWAGYVLEHVYVAEFFFDRLLLDSEVVHHLDLNKLNNHYENLIIIDRGQHTKLHKWLDRINIKRTCFEHKTSFKKCHNCDKYFLNKNQTAKYCSHKCSYMNNINIGVLTKEELSSLLWRIPTREIAKIYVVSDTAIAKLAKKYDLPKPPRGYWTKLKSVS